MPAGLILVTAFLLGVLEWMRASYVIKSQGVTCQCLHLFMRQSGFQLLNDKWLSICSNFMISVLVDILGPESLSSSLF